MKAEGPSVRCPECAHRIPIGAQEDVEPMPDAEVARRFRLVVRGLLREIVPAAFQRSIGGQADWLLRDDARAAALSRAALGLLLEPGQVA